MDAEPGTWRAEELLAQAGWLTGLARGLVGDSAAADDVVQDTLVAALQRPPRARARAGDERGPRPWLAQVARNFARQHRRGEQARRERERRHGVDRAGGELPGPDELSERLEGQRLLVEALGELGEPYRSTVLLRYWEGLSSSEIAERLGVPAGTVRWRLKQGLDQLRSRLDDRFDGNRRAWGLVLAPLVQLARREELALTGTAAAGGVLQGVLAMQTIYKVGAAVVALGLVAGGLYWAGDLAEPAFALPSQPVAVTFEPLPATGVGLPATGEPASPREVVAQPATDPPVPAIPVARARLEARILDALDRPLAGVELLTVPGWFDPPAATLSDSAGRAELTLELARGESVRVEVRAPGYATRRFHERLRPGETTYLGDVVLSPGGAVGGRVLDGEGHPLQGAQVGTVQLDIPQSELQHIARVSAWVNDEGPEATTDADGRFLLQGTPIGFVRLSASAEDYLVDFSGPVEVREAQVSRGVELQLRSVPQRQRIRGLVTDPEGRPVPYASVRWSVRKARGSSSGSTSTDRDGRFEMVVKREGTYVFEAHDVERRWAASPSLKVEPGSGEVLLTLRETKQVELVVRSAAGRPLETFRAVALERESLAVHGVTERGPHEGGRALLRVPLVEAEFDVEVDATGYAVGRVGPYRSSTLPERLEVVLERTPSLTGRVQADGRPFEGALVEAFEFTEQKHSVNDFPVRYDPSVRLSVRTDDEGLFRLSPREAGRFLLRITAEGHAPAELGPFDHDPRVELDAGLANLGRGGAIEGRLVPSPGRSPAGVVVGFSRHDGHAFTRRLGPEGTFRAEGLTPGPWQVVVVETEIGDHGRSTQTWPRGSWGDLPADCEVFEGGVTRHDIDLSGGPVQAAIQLAGEVSVDGRVPGAWNAILQQRSPGGGWEPPEGESTLLDGSGRFRLTSSKPGEHRLILTALGGELDGWRALVRVELGEGTTPWRLDLQTASLEVSGVPANGPGQDFRLGLLWVADSMLFMVQPLFNEGSESGDGQVARRRVPAGEVAVWRIADIDQPDPATWPTQARITLAPGEVGQLTLQP